MVDYKNLINDVVNATPSQRIALGRHALADVLAFLAQNEIEPDNISKLVAGLIIIFISADKEGSLDELETIRAITDIDFTEEEFYQMLKGGYDHEAIKALEDVIESLPPHQKASVCLFGLSILASDGELTKEEEKLFNRISK